MFKKEAVVRHRTEKTATGQSLFSEINLTVNSEYEAGACIYAFAHANCFFNPNYLVFDFDLPEGNFLDNNIRHLIKKELNLENLDIHNFALYAAKLFFENSPCYFGANCTVSNTNIIANAHVVLNKMVTELCGGTQIVISVSGGETTGENDEVLKMIKSQMDEIMAKLDS